MRLEKGIRKGGNGDYKRGKVGNRAIRKGGKGQLEMVERAIGKPSSLLL